MIVEYKAAARTGARPSGSRRTQRERVVPGRTYAFAVADGLVSFPGTGLMAPECWPLDDTVVELVTSRRLHVPQLRLTNPVSERERVFELASLKRSGPEILHLAERERAVPQPESEPLASGRRAAVGDVRIAMNPWTQECIVDEPYIHRRMRGAAPAAALLFIAAGAITLVVAMGTVTGQMDAGVWVPTLVGDALLALMGVFMLLAARWGRVEMQRWERAARMWVGGECAFRITLDGDVDVVAFEAGWGLEADRWPLADTMIETYGQSGETGVELRCPGREPRRFSAGALQLSPQTVVALVNNRE